MKCNLYWLCVLLFGCIGLQALAGPADFEAPTKVIIVGYDDHAMEPFLSRDGEWLFFNNRNLPRDQTDIQLAKRAGDGRFEYVGPLAGTNSDALDGVPSLDRQGNFYFVSPRDYGETHNTLMQAEFTEATVRNVRPLPGNASRRKPLWLNIDAEISANGQTLYFVENHWRLLGGGLESSNIYSATRNDTGAFIRDDDAEVIFASINSDLLEFAPATTSDELTLYFTRADPVALRSGRPDGFGIFVATRGSRDEAFSKPSRITAIEGYVEGPTTTPDECGIMFHKKIGGRFEIWSARRTDCL